MNNGFNGTGTAFILYVVLAFCMPIVYIYRILKHGRNYSRRFIAGHFALAVTLYGIAWIIIGHLWHQLAYSSRGRVREIILGTAWVAIATLVLWILIPYFVIMWHRLCRKSVRYVNPLIHPWIEKFIDSRPRQKVDVDGIGPGKTKLELFPKN